MLLRTLSILTLLATFACAASAATLTVTNLNDSGAGSLRDTIASAATSSPGDTIVFQSGLAGTITLASELQVNKPLTINGPAATPGITVSGNNTVRCFHFSGAVAVAAISNLTIANGRAGFSSNFGGGMRILTGFTVTLTNVTFSGCATPSGGSGGALMVNGATSVSLVNCTFTSNTSLAGGGAIYQQSTPMTATGCTFANNSASGSGGAIVINAAFTLTNCTFSANSSSGIDGGAIYASGPLTAVDCALAGNTASSGSGGAIHFSPFTGSNSTLSGCTLSGSTAESGGAISFDISGATATVSLTNCTLSANHASYSALGGGALFISQTGSGTSTVNLTNCTLSGNTATGVTGTTILASALTGSTVNITYRNTIISGAGSSNIAAINSGTTNLTSLDNNLCSDATGNLTGANDKPSTPANLAALANNGGPTQTHLPLTGSAAIDGGRAITGVTADQRGYARPQDDGSVANAANGDGSDIGAVEVGIAGPEIGVARSGNPVVDGSSDNFSGASAGSPQMAGYTISNTGSAALSLTGSPSLVAVSAGANVSSVTVSAFPASSVAAAMSTNFSVTFTVTAAGSFSFAVSIANNDSNENPYDFTVSGTAAGLPEMNVTRSGFGTQVDDGATHNFDPITGVTWPIGFVISNSGTANLTITNPVGLSGATNCSVSVATAPASSVAPGNSTTLAITLSTPTSGPYSFNVSIPNNDANENPYDFTVSGTVTGSGSNNPSGPDGSGGCGASEAASILFAALIIALSAMFAARRIRCYL